MKKRSWIALSIVVIVMLVYFVLFLHLGTLTDIKYGAIDRMIMSDHSGISTDVQNSVYGYINVFSIFIAIQFVIIFYLLYKINKK